jgi:hypothetical protein
MDEDLSTTGQGLRRRLDEAVILRDTVAQLRKDLDMPELEEPEVGDAAFEALRRRVLNAIEGWAAGNGPALSRAINRVDLTERQVDDATGRGGLPELAGSMVLRCLQKVLLRLHFSGRA